MKSDRATESASESPAPISRQFDEIAFLYDELMVGVPYSAWVNYVERILHRMGRHPASSVGASSVGAGVELQPQPKMRVLDLCCGTGNASVLMARRGYDIVGIDIAPEMIELARQKARDAGFSLGQELNSSPGEEGKVGQIEYYVGDASAFSVPGKFDLVISLFDSLNYILEASKLQQAFYRVAAHLEQDGLFIFDMNTEFALSAGFFDQSNAATRGPVVYDWKSSYNSITCICRIAMRFLYRKETPPREIELVHYQRAYDIDEVCEMLRTSGLEVHAVYDGYSFHPATRRSDRVFFVARKV